MRAAPLGLRVFCEGVEIPGIAAQVSIQPGSPATASIQIVPTDAALSILPRTLVHLFYLDDMLTEQEAAMARDRVSKAYRNGPGTTIPEVDRIEAPDEQYKLLFVGEVIGVNYSKTPVSRQMVLQCMDLSSYWDACYQWFADYSVHGGGFTDKTHIFIQAGSGLFDNIASGTTWVVSSILLKPPSNLLYKDCKGLLGGIISLLEVIGGVRPSQSTFKACRGVNDFFTVAELRYNLSSMIGAVAADTTSAALYDKQAFISWMQNGMSSLGNLVSFRDILNQVCQWVFHDVYPNPSCMFIPPGTVSVNTVKNINTNGITKDGRDELTKIRALLSEAIDKLSHVSAIETYDDETRKSFFDAYFRRVTTASTRVEDLIDVNNKLDVHILLQQLSDRIVQSIIPVVSELEESINEVRDNLSVAISIIDEIRDGGESTISKTVKKRAGGHLFNQLVLPETFFMAPPRCNVLFPDQYTSFSYSRNFMREVTRLSCSAGPGWLIGGGKDPILSHYYFAPNILDDKGQSLHSTLRDGARIILPHEVHSGIIPKMEWVSEAHRWSVKASKADNQEGRIHYLQKLANFQFFLSRWSARSIGLSARFSPQLVLGFPALVIDRAAPAPEARKAIEQILGKEVLPTQYLGKVAAITHSLSQAGGTTEVNLTHCRTHRGSDDDFLGALQEGLTYHRKLMKTGIQVSIDINAMSKNMAKYKPSVSPKDANVTTDVVKKLLATISTMITRKVSFLGPTATRAELLSAGFSNNEVDLMTPLNSPVPSEKSAVMMTEGILNEAETFGSIDNAQKLSERYQTPKNIRNKTYYRFVVDRANWGAKVPGVGTINFVEVSQTPAYLHQSTLAKMGIVVDASFKDAAKGLAIPEGERTGFFIYPDKVIVWFDHFTSEKVSPDGGKFRVEDILTPDWYSKDAWSHDNIGEKVYGFLLGCGAIIDDPSLMNFTEPAEETNESLNMRQSSGQMSLEDAVDGLSCHYGRLMERGQDVHAFIRSYTYRPIASLPEIMGSPDFDIDENGTVTGTEGFHSRAFGDYNTDVKYVEGKPAQAGRKALTGLIEDGIPTVNRMDQKVNTRIPPYLDPRGRARQRILAYMAELNLNRGLQG